MGARYRFTAELSYLAISYISLHLLNTGIADSNSTQTINVSLSCLCLAVLCRQRRCDGLITRPRFPVKMSKQIHNFRSNFESQQPIKPNPQMLMLFLFLMLMVLLTEQMIQDVITIFVSGYHYQKHHFHGFRFWPASARRINSFCSEYVCEIGSILSHCN
jgi:hypothetical protein